MASVVVDQKTQIFPSQNSTEQYAKQLDVLINLTSSQSEIIARMNQNTLDQIASLKRIEKNRKEIEESQKRQKFLAQQIQKSQSKLNDLESIIKKLEAIGKKSLANY
jgi:hypothetical protein